MHGRINSTGGAGFGFALEDDGGGGYNLILNYPCSTGIDITKSAAIKVAEWSFVSVTYLIKELGPGNDAGMDLEV